VQPGKSTKIEFKMKSLYLARATGGKFSKSITITTNDKVNPTTKLWLTGVARHRVAAPAAIPFASVKADVETVKTVTITNNTETSLKLTMPETKVDSKNPFKYELTEKEPGKTFELKVTTVPPLAEGRVSSELVIGTNIKEQPEVKIRLSLNVPPRIQVKPSLIAYNPRRTTVPVTVTNNGLTDVKVVGAETDDPALDVSVHEVEEGKRYTLKVTFPENYKPPKDNANRKLTIKTDDPEKGEIVVPIRTAYRAPKPRPAEQLKGKPAPEFEMKTTEGKTLNNGELAKSKAVVMTFWAADCPYCRKALPRIETVRKGFAGKDVRFVNVTEKMRKTYTEDQLKALLKTLKVEAELVVDQSNKIGPKFKASGFPTLFVLGKTGNVEMVTIGNVANLESSLTKKLNQLLGIKITADKKDEAAKTKAETGTTPSTATSYDGMTKTKTPDKPDK